MSTVPPTSPLEGIPADVPSRPQDVRNGMAIAAFVLGLIGLLACVPAGLLALILGIIALVRAQSEPTIYRGRGLAIAGICCGILSLAEVPVLLSSLSRARQLAMYAVCGANLRGIGQGMHIYANDNAGWFPCAPYPESTRATSRELPASTPNWNGVSFIAGLSANYTLPTTAAGLTRVHPSRSLFLLVIGGNSSPKQFTCPSSGDSEDSLRNKSGASETPAQPGVNRFDFRGYPNLSYGYQMPFGPLGKPRRDLDPRMVIAADKGPYFEAGPTNPADGSTPDRLCPTASAPSFSEDAADILKLRDKPWRPFNSRNHNGEGQYVLYVDGHVEFQRKPIVGINYDNIYTEQAGYTLKDTLLGLRPRDGYGPLTNTDTILIP
jgi:hypothetical protein